MARTVQDLRERWEAPPGLLTWFGTVDHKVVGVRYIYTAFLFFLVGGLEALLMRLQLARPENHFLSPEAYNQLFTMHGTTMIFLFATPILFGLGNYFVPLMIGARDVAYPRLNAFGYWIFLFAGLFMYASFLLGQAPNGGWFAYVPLTGPTYTPGLNQDFYNLGLLFLGIGTTGGAINFIATILKLRAPGMTLGRMPLFIWTILITSFAVIFALPALNAANLLLTLERKLGWHFFDPAFGGQPLLWQHLFWIFGHPDVYIIVLPAFGIVSEIISTFSRRSLVGYTWVAMASVATGIIGFGVWAHHMFATSLSPMAASFFSAASFVIGVPAGIQIFAWLATLLTGRPVIKTPLLYIAGFIVVFVIGGLSGVMFPLVSFDRQVTDSYFVVAHFHYVLIGGMLFPLFGGLYYWLPKITGRLLDERAGVWSFWLVFTGFNLTFFPMHILGLLGMPRRVYTYLPGLGFDGLNLLATIGAFVLGLGILVSITNFWRSLQSGVKAGDNPWGAATLEWATTSPPPAYNFRTIPAVGSAYPLWDNNAPAFEDPTDPFKNQTLATSIVTAEPEDKIPLPRSSTEPFFLAVGLALVFIRALTSLQGLMAVGIIVSLVFIFLWMRPVLELTHAEGENERLDPHTLPRWGILLLILTEAALFASLVGAYVFLEVNSPVWPPNGVGMPELRVPIINTVLLLASSFTVIFAGRGLRRGHRSNSILGLVATMVLGTIFLILQIREFRLTEFTPGAHAYGSIFFTVLSLHGLHVLLGLLLLLATLIWLLRGHFTANRHITVHWVSLYWHFVDAVWLLMVLPAIYLSPYLGGR